MSSYHRILNLFGRSVQDKSLECDCDIHPWEILINNERWPGKIRLIGFVDVFFLICYTGDYRFEQGIVIYKEDQVIRDTFEELGLDPETIGMVPVNESEAKRNSKVLPRYVDFKSGAIDYTISSLGHEIGLQTEYPKSALKKYEIKLRKNKSPIMKRRIRRGITQHTVTDLMQDAIRMGLVTHAELTAQLMGHFVVGGAADDAMRKYLDTLASVNRPDTVSLSNERT